MIRTIDFETFYDVGYSLSGMTTEAYIRSPLFEVIGVSWKDDDGPTQWFSGTHQQTYEKLHSLSWDCAVLAHNCLFDGAILTWRFGIRPKAWLDTLSMAQPIIALTPGGSLAKLAQHFDLGVKGTEVVSAKGKRRDDFTPQELAQYGEYCKNDTELTYKLYKKLEPYSTPQEQYIIDVLLRMYTDPVIELDRGVLEEHLQDVRNKQAVLLAKIEQLCGKDTLMSNPKLQQILESWGVDVPMKLNKNGELKPAFAKSDDAFKALLEHEDPRVQTVVAARLGVKSTIEESRTQSFIEIAGRGTLPIGLKYYAAHTGRSGGTEKVNPQNLPAARNGNPGKLRRSLRAPEGHVLVACDSSQIEARVVAALANQTDLVEAFRTGADIYNEFGADIYGRPIDRKGEDKSEGHVAKAAVLGLGFGMGAPKFQKHVKTAGVTINEVEAQRVVHIYRNKYNQIARLWMHGKMALKAVADGREFALGLGRLMLPVDAEGIHLPNGMLLRYPHLVEQHGGFYYCKDPRQVVAYVGSKLTGEEPFEKMTHTHGAKVIENVVQALARIVVFHQMCKIDQWCKQRDDPRRKRTKVVLSAHDETVICVPEHLATEASEYMEKVMSTPPSWWPELPVACEVSSGKTYVDCK